MNESDLAAHQTTDQHLFRLRDGAQRGIDVLGLGMRPPASADRLTHDGLDKIGSVPLGRCQNNASFLHECHRVLGVETGLAGAGAHGAQRSMEWLGVMAHGGDRGLHESNNLVIRGGSSEGANLASADGEEPACVLNLADGEKALA